MANWRKLAVQSAKSIGRRVAFNVTFAISISGLQHFFQLNGLVRITVNSIFYVVFLSWATLGWILFVSLSFCDARSMREYDYDIPVATFLFTLLLCAAILPVHFWRVTGFWGGVLGCVTISYSGHPIFAIPPVSEDLKDGIINAPINIRRAQVLLAISLLVYAAFLASTGLVKWALADA